MTVVASIFDAFGGVSALSDATGFPQQTVSEWRNREPMEIPPWRRPSVADAARRLGKTLTPEAVTYLASNARTPKAAVQQASKPAPAEAQAA